MINFENFHKTRQSLSGFEEYKIVNSLLKSFANARANDTSIAEPKFNNCYYDKEWKLDFVKKPVDIFEYSFNCLRIYLTYNHEELENAKFFRSIDLFYKYLLQYFQLNKKEWLAKIYAYAKQSDHHKAPVFIKNMDQYFEKQKIMDDMKCLIK